MTPEPEIDFHNLPELGKVFDDVIDEVGHNSARRMLHGAIREALRPDRHMLKTLTPVDTGNLQRHVRMNVSKSKSWTAVGFLGWGGRKDTIRKQQMLAIEYGTEEMAAHVELRGLFERRKGIWMDRFVKTLWGSINDVLEKSVAKRGRGKWLFSRR